MKTFGTLRRFTLAVFSIVFLAALFADLRPARAQYGMGFSRFGGPRPMMRGRFAGPPYGWRGRHPLPPPYGWRGGGWGYHPAYPYPGYPGYSAPPNPTYSASRPTHHRVAQNSPPPAPPSHRHTHRGSASPQHVAATKPQQFMPHEIITEFSSNASPQAIDRLAHRFGLIHVETKNFALIGTELTRWHIADNRPVESVVASLKHEKIVASVQPNYVFTLQEQSVTPIQGDPAQYVLGKLEATAAHRLATGKHVRVALIDSDIDAKQPDLKGAIIESFDALGGDTHPHTHGTAMAGAIAAHGKLLGIAPDAELLAARAFDDTPGLARGNSFSIYEGLQWAADNGARIVNMSFAGPEDPTLHRMLAAAYLKNMVLIAAGGNAGAKSAPLYPAADPDVIAVTATDSDDHIYDMANRGAYIALAAPGVEILVDAPGTAYQITTGTSVAAAHVSGIAALLLQYKPSLTPSDVRATLMATARVLGTADQSTEFGAGLADAYRALVKSSDTSAKPADVQAKK
jgi:subtilisin family serine protease